MFMHKYVAHESKSSTNFNFVLFLCYRGKELKKKLAIQITWRTMHFDETATVTIWKYIL